uniref:Uncharacterized protein n=1 Tax=Oryza glaberrima TaxID=4538 RepID=A0A679BDB7_ORYGL|nr:hypothetical protein [Oryza glaberrima]
MHGAARRHEGGGAVERKRGEKRGMGGKNWRGGGGIYREEGEEGEGVAGLMATRWRRTELGAATRRVGDATAQRHDGAAARGSRRRRDGRAARRGAWCGSARGSARGTTATGERHAATAT